MDTSYYKEYNIYELKIMVRKENKENEQKNMTLQIISMSDTGIIIA